MAEPKKLYRDSSNKMVAGVASGLANYFSIDVGITRLALLALIMFTAVVPGIIFYLIAAIIIPAKDSNGKED